METTFLDLAVIEVLDYTSKQLRTGVYGELTSAFGGCVLYTGETQYNKIFGTMKLSLFNQIFVISVAVAHKQYKIRDLFHWDRRKQLVISGILLYQISLSSFHCIMYMSAVARIFVLDY